MRTTFILKDDLYQKAAQLTGIREKTKLIHLGLESLIRDQAARRLIHFFGTVKNAKAPLRRKAKWI